mgnify:CR=1 FL=1
MNTITRKRLIDAGWHEKRDVDIGIYIEKFHKIGLDIPVNIESFLRNFGMLKIDVPEKTYFDVEFNPLKAIGNNLDADYFKECLSDYGILETGYPIGVACRNNLIILMTITDVVYCFTDGCLVKAGNSIEEMLDCLVGECKEIEEIE